MMTNDRIQKLISEGCLDQEKWLLAKEVQNLREEIKNLHREYRKELKDAIQGAREEATFRMIQGDDYGSY